MLSDQLSPAERRAARYLVQCTTHALLLTRHLSLSHVTTLISDEDFSTCILVERGELSRSSESCESESGTVISSASSVERSAAAAGTDKTSPPRTSAAPFITSSTLPEREEGETPVIGRKCSCCWISRDQEYCCSIGSSNNPKIATSS